MSISSKSSSKYSKKKMMMDRLPKDDLLDRYYPPDQKICQIVATKVVEKVDPLFIYRPKSSKEYLSYNLSQTEAKMDCGPTKIHFSQIRAEYERYPEDFVFPEEKAAKKKRRSRGRGPVWLFLDEILKRKIDKEQLLVKRKMEERMMRKHLLQKNEKKQMLSKIVEMALPDWFQELSNLQKQSMDGLEKAILKDLKQHTICNVQESLARLGLVLRPNHCNVERALNNCCGNPIQFLLLILKYSKPKGLFDTTMKTGYTLNDRLILSAIVHLVSPMLLREMHVRIPSPPPVEEEPSTIIPCKKKRVHYTSPYLEPFTFEREPPKHTGIYKNQHIQYPASPYFSYLPSFYFERILIQDENGEESNQKGKRGSKLTQRTISDTSYENCAIEKELSDERDLAQAEYDEMFKDRKTVKLMRASVYQECIPEKSKKKDKIVYEADVNEDDAIEEEHKEGDGNNQVQGEPTISEDKEEVVNQTVPTSSVMLNVTLTQGDKDGNVTVITQQYEVDKTTALNIITTGDPNLLDADLFPPKPEELPFEIQPMCPQCIPISGGITYDRDGHPVPIIAGLIRPDLVCKCVKLPTKKSEESINIFDKKKKPRDECICFECLQKAQKKREEKEERRRLQNLLCNCEICSCKNRISTPPPSVPSIPNFTPPSQDIYKKEETHDELIEIKEPPLPHCYCKQVVNEYLQHKQHLDSEVVSTKKPKGKTTYLIMGHTKTGEPIIGTTKASKECRCLEKYQQRIAKYEEQKRIEQAQAALKGTKKTFVIGGVKLGPDGKPIFMVSGVSSEKPCGKCIENQQTEQREKLRIAEMPVFPLGRITYHISGVQRTPKGNVFVISGVQDKEPCNCMTLYNIFMKKHSRCMQVYQQYLQKIKTDIKEYLEDLAPQCQNCRVCGTCGKCLECKEFSLESANTQLDISFPLAILEDMPSFPSKGIASSATKPKAETSVPIESQPKEPAIQAKHPSEDLSQPLPTKLTTDFPPLPPPNLPPPREKDMSTSTSAPSCPTSMPSQSQSSLNTSDECICVHRAPPDHIESIPNEETTTLGEETPEEIEEEKGATCSRYLLLKKIPCEREKHSVIIKNVLKCMANDGYPIVGLPGSYKLPIFRIWMTARCGGYWTMQDRANMMAFSKQFWQELEKCSHKIPVERLNISNAKAARLTWANSKYVKDLTDSVKEVQYRRVKQTLIRQGRDYFPSMVDYELPTPSFRNCYFAYIPPKEEAVFPRFPWERFQYRNYSQMRERRARKNWI